MLLALSMLVWAQDAVDPGGAWGTAVRPLIERHCLDCHAGEEPKGELDLAAAAPADRALWTEVRAALRFDEMPPAGRPRPEPVEVERALAWIDAAFGRAAEERAPRHGGALRRMNRREYANTVRDLFGVEPPPPERLPADGVGHGFDTVGDALSMSSASFEKALLAAEWVAARAFAAPDPPVPAVRRTPGSQLEVEGGANNGRSHAMLFSRGSVAMRASLPREGVYLLRASAWATRAGDDLARLRLTVDGRRIETFDIAAARDAPEVVEASARLEGGEHAVAAAFLNDFYEPENPDPQRRDRNLYVAWIEVEGPIDEQVLPPYQRAHFDGAATAELRPVLAALARRVWRRPPTEVEVGALAGLSDAGEPLEARVRTAVVALLASPNFLFYAGPEAGDDWGLAARLAAFLWSSTPDDRLLDLAASGRLSERGALLDEARRMLRDARSSALGEGFALQWLQLEGLAQFQSDPALYPDVDGALRASMLAETKQLFETVLREARPARELLAADFTFLDERLARHYGVPGVQGAHLRRVPVADLRRRGLLGHASVLTATSHPTRTSPVKRGKWILDVLFNAPPPAPPPGVDDLDESPEAVRSASLRERLEEHRARPACATCHETMDELGFGLENFDATGAWRSHDGAFPIDSAGLLPDGRGFAGPVELRALLEADGALSRTLVEKLMVYALGRGLERADRAAAASIVEGAAPDPTLQDLILGVVGSDAFRGATLVQEPTR